METSYEPQVVLEALNRRLCGRGQSYATCVAMHIAADGKATIANAGHIAPYLNGKELDHGGQSAPWPESARHASTRSRCI